MEGVKSLMTGAHSVAGYAVIQYRLFTAHSEVNAGNATSDREILETAEASLHEQGRLAVKDLDTGCVWLFENKQDDSASGAEPSLEPEQPAVEGISLHLVAQGLLKLLDIPKARLRAMFAVSSKSPITPTTASLAAQIMNAKAVRANAGADGVETDTAAKPPDFDSPQVLPWFIAAVETSVSFQLASKLDYTPLNSRTWVTSPPRCDNPLTPPGEELAEPVVLLSLSAYVTTAGTLVLSFTSTTRPDMRRLARDRASESTSPLIIRLAPNGSLAKVVGSDESDALATRTPTNAKQRAVALRDKLHDRAWKTLATDWLSRKGIRIATEEVWVDIQLSQDAASAPSAKEKLVQCLWPASLCFAYLPGVEVDPGNPRKDASEGLRWFRATDSAFSDPLDAAQQWFAGKSEREQSKEARRRMLAAQQEQVALNDSGLFPASPFYTRPDLAAAGGVYPTPPDGILTQPTTATQAVDTPYVPPSTVETQAVGATPSNLPANAEDSVMENTSPTNADKDLFGDMDMDDEDNFAGNELSDADFNFFDQPDDVSLPDAVGGDSTTPAIPVENVHAAEEEEAAGARPVEQEDKGAAALEALKLVTPSDPSSVLTHVAATVDVPDTPAGKPLTDPLQPSLLDRRELLRYEASAQQTSHQRLGNVNFHNQLSTADAKYASGGIFGSLPSSEHRLRGIPLPARRRSSAFDHRIIPNRRLSARDAVTSPQAPTRRRNMSLTGVPRLDIGADSDTEDTSSTASLDEFAPWDDTHHVQGETPVEQRVRKRARQHDERESSNSTPKQNVDEEDMQPPSLDELALAVKETEVIGLFEPEYADWSLERFPAPSLERPAPTSRQVGRFLGLDVASNDQEGLKIAAETNLGAFIGVAQLVAEQSALSTLQTTNFQPGDDSILAHGDSDCTATQNIPVNVSTALASLFPEIAQLDLVRYAHIQDAPFEPLPGSRAMHRPPTRKTTAGPLGADMPSPNTLFSVQPQHVRVRRGETLWDLLPTALSFWELLGLGPASGGKNIVTYCIYPDSDALLDPLNSFLTGLGSTYEGCKLGAHRRGAELLGCSSNLIPVRPQNTSSTTYSSVQKALHDLSTQLGHGLATSTTTETDELMQDTNQAKPDEAYTSVNSIVLYAIDVFETPTSLRDLCTFFWSLRGAYLQACRSQSPVERKPDLVLQVVPVSCISGTDAPVFLDQKALISLAREVYDRCPPTHTSSTGSVLSIRAAPSVQLEETVPRAIPFRLIAEPPAELLHDCSHLHLGYAVSWKGGWLTAAWTDGSGKYQTIASYNMIDRTIGDTAKEIWQTTLGIMQARKVTWRVTIAKAGVMEREELEAWASLVSSTSPMPVGAVLMAIDTSPSLQLSRPLQQPTAAPTTITPVSTPQGVSPSDPTANAAATPSDAVQDAANDPDAHLVDVTDEIWGVILSHRLSNSSSLTEIRPCLASGFLVNKDGDSYGVRGPQCTGYNIIWIGSSSRTSASAAAAAAAASSSAQNQPQTPMTPGGPAAHASTAAAFAQGIAASMVAQQQQQQAQQQQGASHSTAAPGAATTGATPRFGGATIDPILKDYLTVYRGLSMLARLRGMRGTRGGTAPWHIVAAMNGVDALEKCMDA